MQNVISAALEAGTEQVKHSEVAVKDPGDLIDYRDPPKSFY